MSSVESFLQIPGKLIDVRSPSEYAAGHIHGAFNLPLLNDEERTLVGTSYKKQGKNDAISLGLDLVSPKVETLISQALTLVGSEPAKIYCWRGGMRSQAIAHLLNASKIPTTLLPGGYKAYRHYAHTLFSQPWQIQVLGGYTGTGKTNILHELHSRGEQVLDLEALAQHRGSAYGMLGMPSQPTTEHFQNLIAAQLASFSPNKTLWIEDESRALGTCHLPVALYTQMQTSPIIVIERPLHERLEILKQAYGNFPPQAFIASTQKISKKLGGSNTQKVIAHIENGQFHEALLIILNYYDKAYQHALNQRAQPPVVRTAAKLSTLQWVNLLLDAKTLGEKGTQSSQLKPDLNSR